MSISYSVDLKAPGRPYPHYWEFCVGSCHAATILREDVREHIRKAHRECGFRYLRFHGLFDDDMSVYFVPMMGEPIISFYNIDCIFDFLLDIGMKPFIELGFMPTALASGDYTLFHYKANATMPKDDAQWQRLIRLFAEHLLERYGREEVSQWFFEVWNEPNLRFFFDGTQEDYFHLYEMTARTLKAVDPCLQVGGPATSVNAWIPAFRQFCESNDVPYDFITTHHYPSDDPLSSMGMNGPGHKGEMFDSQTAAKMTPEEMEAAIKDFISPKENKNPRDVLAQMTRKAKEEAGDRPLYYTEWNGSKEFDTSYQAAFIAHTLSYNDGYVKGYSFWTVSDIFEEMGMKPGPFKNEFGIQTNHGVAKPSYRVFQVLHEAGDIRIDVPGQDGLVEVLALKNGDEATVLVYNHDLERRMVKAEEVRLTLGGAAKAWKAVIDGEHCSPLKAWQEMGEPAYLSREQTAALHRASELIYEPVDVSGPISFTAQPESVTVFKVRIG